MYNLSPRDFNPGSSQTPECVGPSTYVICDGQHKRVNRVPFLSSEKKVSKFFNKVYCEALYDLPQFNIKGGSTPRNRSQRFVYEESDTPGPAEYVAKLPKCVRIDPTPIPGKGRLYACRVPYTVHASAPSIPTELDANGYDIDEDGNIVKIPPDKKDKSMGPAYYHVKTSTFCEYYRGCKWSHHTSKRAPPKADNTPGPGTYDIQLPKCRKLIVEEEVREMARRFSYVPRFMDAQQLKFEREGMPGPADYDIRKFKLCPGSPGVFPKPFITGSERFRQTGGDSPSPDTYNIVTVKHTVSKKHIPFFVQSSRFGGKQPFVTPGPGAYEIESPINEKLRSKKNVYASFEPPFNKTSPRDTSNLNKDAISTPSPTNYTLNEEGKCKIPPTSVFVSKVERIKKLCKKKGVSPAHYDANEVFRRVKDQRSHNVKKVSFNSLSERKGLIDDTECPGPADYLGQGDLPDRGYYIPSSPRSRYRDAELPGPGTYSIHPAYDSSVYKAISTHNLRIKENVVRRKLRRSPNETWARWAATIKKKKQLKWFVNGGKDYVHC